jgi:sulfate adenylyltransferase large subunit
VPPSAPHTPAGASSSARAGDAGLLRLITCGSVDDGKSTLIGRMLYDSKGIFQDQWEAISRTSKSRGDAEVDLALLTDGLRAEREQGITIDVAYRYFSTPRRKFILADTPGHVQYTRNMATGASTADAALILIDARQGVVEQTRRHACLATLLGIAHLVVCINKMDLVGFDQARFDEIRAAFQYMSAAARPDAGRSVADRIEATFIPMSALAGDNVVTRSSRTPWYSGPTLMEHLDTVPDRALEVFPGARLPIQYVIRPQTPEHHDYRGYAGRVASGTFRVGDEVAALPGGQRSRIARIHLGERDLPACAPGQSVAVLLTDDVDIARGDTLVLAADLDAPPSTPTVSSDVCATVVWMTQTPLAAGRRVLVKHTTRTTPAVVKSIEHRLNIQTLAIEPGDGKLGLNEIGRVRLKTGTPLVFDPYERCRGTGAFIIIDEQTNNTVGAGMILPAGA